MLPDFVLADIFRNHIVAVEEEKTQAVEKPAISPLEVEDRQPGRWYLGNNARQLLVIVADAHAAVISDKDLAFLTKILSAFQYTLEDVTVVNHVVAERDFASLRKDFNPAIVLLFGVSTVQVQLPFAIPYYQVQPYDNCIFLAAPLLEDLNADSPESRLDKSKLWICLKNIFGK